MRMSQLFGRTLRDAPAGSEVAGHQLLLRAGALRQLTQGVFSYLPVGLRVLRRIEGIVREEMEAAGGVEVSLPVVHPAELWRASGRLTSTGPELTRFEDRRQRGLVLAMTHEEVVAALASSEVHSWRDLPRLVFQIQTKFRDDPRPRAGLIRAREFTMKDAYSLDRDEAGLDEQYQRLHHSYERVFARCGLPVLAVGSDVGMMGGSAAHEFMYLTPIGEDTVVLCDACGYAQNRQVAGFAKPAPPGEQPAALDRVATPEAATIAALVEVMGVDVTQTAKVVFFAADGPGRGEAEPMEARPVVAVVRGDMTVNETKLAQVLGATDLRPLTDEEITAIGCAAGYASPIGIAGRATVIADDLVAASPNLVMGANEAGFHLRNVNAPRDWAPDLVADIVAAEDGFSCPVCAAPLRTARGVEVGNIFKLGTRYPTALGAHYLDRDGTERPVVMGSYGIGMGRLMACIAEEHHDDAGIRWPAAVAPFDVHICALGDQNLSAAESLLDALAGAGLSALLDDRGERPGVQFADADLIGAPLRVTVSARSLRAGGVEVLVRDGSEPAVVPPGDVVGWASAQLRAEGETAAERPPHEPGDETSPAS